MLLNRHTQRLHCVWRGCRLPSAMALHGWPAVWVRLWRRSGSTVVDLVPQLQHLCGACRRRHADVIELLWFLNSWGSELVYGLSYGDKDTFSLAFSLAGKPEQYYQAGSRGVALRPVKRSCNSAGRVTACHPCWQARAGQSQ